MTKLEDLFNLISAQQQGEGFSAAYGIGLQLKDICSDNPALCDIVIEDLKQDKMSLRECAKTFKKYADKNHGKDSCFCIPPTVADNLIREFYGLPKKGAEPETKTPVEEVFDLSEFL